MSGSDSKEKQPAEVLEADQFLSGMAKLKIKEPEVKDLDDELCKTPTAPENQIRVVSCPPAPRKKTPAPSAVRYKQLYAVRYIVVRQEEIDAFFKACEESSRGNKKRKIN